MSRPSKASARGDSPAAADSAAPDRTDNAALGAAEAGGIDARDEWEKQETADLESKADAEARLAGHPPADKMVGDLRALLDGVTKWHAAAEHHARAFGKASDHTMHAKFSRLAGIIAEFRNGLATV